MQVNENGANSVKSEFENNQISINLNILRQLELQDAEPFKWMSTHQLRKNLGLQETDRQRLTDLLNELHRSGTINRYKESDGRDYYWSLNPNMPQSKPE